MVYAVNGGIGNRLNGLACSVSSNRTFTWNDGIGVAGLGLWDIIEENESVRNLFKEGIGGAGVWLFPGCTRLDMGWQHEYYDYLTNRGNNKILDKHFNNGKIGLLKPNMDIINSISIKDYGSRHIDSNTIGIHLRLLHPRIKVDIDMVINEVNRISEFNPIYVASDVYIKGFSDRVLYDHNHKVIHDIDRDVDMVKQSLREWRTLGKCNHIYRSSPISTFVDWHCFVHNKIIKPLHNLPFITDIQ